MNQIEKELTESIQGGKEFFLEQAEQLIASYAEDNGVGPADDPQVFTSWIATILLKAHLAGIQIAFDAIHQKEG